MKSGRAGMEGEFGRRLLPLARRWRSEADEAVAGLGLSHATGWVLLHVGRLRGADDVRQSDLAAGLDMRASSLVPQLDRLEQAGLVTRLAEDGDRRVNRIGLTMEGAALVGRIERALLGIRRELLDGVSDEELAVTTRVIALLDDRMLDRRSARP